MENGYAITGEQTPVDIVHGKAGGTLITLIDLDPGPTTTSVFDFPSTPYEQRLRVGTILVNAHVRDDTAFATSTISIEGLTTWAVDGGMLTTTQWQSETNHWLKSTAEIEAVPPIQADLDDLSVELTVDPTISFPKDHSHRRTSSLSQTARLNVTPGEPQPLCWHLELWSKLLDLVSVVSASSRGLLSAAVSLPARDTDSVGGRRGQAPPKPIEVYRFGIPVGATGTKSSSIDFLLPFDADRFEEKLKRWLDVRNRFESTCNILFSLFRQESQGSSAYLEQRFLSAATAAESMAEPLKIDPLIPVEEHKKLRKTLSANTPKSHRQWVSDRLASNKKPLKEQLEFVAHGTDKVLSFELAEWAEEAARTRNSIAHEGSYDLTVYQLLDLYQGTLGIVTTRILLELGTDEQQLRGRTAHNPQLQRSQKALKQLFPSGEA